MSWKVSSYLNNEYEISYDGGFRRLSDGRIFRSYVNKEKGYHYINLIVGGIRVHKRAHRLVAITWIENPNNLPEVNHKDGDKSNNSVENLEWISHIENIRHAINLGLSKRATKPYILSPPKVFSKRSRKINQITMGGEFIRQFRSLHEAAYFSGARISNIRDVCGGRGKSAGGYIWKYGDIDTAAPVTAYLFRDSV